MNGPAVPVRLKRSATEEGRYLSWRADGLLRLDADALVLEYRETCTDYGTTERTDPGAVRRIEVPLGAVESLEVRRRFLRGPLLVLRLRSLAPLDGVRYADGARLSLPVARAEAARARELRGAVAERLAEAALRRLGAGTQ